MSQKKKKKKEILQKNVPDKISSICGKKNVVPTVVDVFEITQSSTSFSMNDSCLAV